ncbi:MAG: Gfo/Idh/MocA family oxidoreductase [Thermodesulfobacteriota bacterium]
MKRIRAAVIGTGYLGKFHAEKYAGLDSAELVGIVDIDGERAAEVAGSLGCDSYTSYEEILDKVDAVSIVTPTETHFSIGRDFLSKGVNVLMEKPMTVTSDEAEELIEIAEKTGVVLQVGHLERFNAAVVALEGKLSNPIFIESHRLSNFPNRGTDVDVVLDLMIHDIDIILNLVKSDVESVDAAGVPIMTDKVDMANARLRFANGCVANVTASRVSVESTRQIKLYQSDAYISIDYAKQNITTYKRKEGAGGSPPSIVGEEFHIVRKDTLLEEIKSFLSCITEEKPPLVSGHDGKRALEVAQLIQDSVKSSMERFTDFNDLARTVESS